jgi:hypothetical protein
MRPKRFRRSGLCLTHSRTFAHRQGKCPLIAIARRKGPVASPAAGPKSTSSRIDTEPRRRLSPLAVLTGPQPDRSTGGGRPALAAGHGSIHEGWLELFRRRRRPVGHKRAEPTRFPQPTGVHQSHLRPIEPVTFAFSSLPGPYHSHVTPIDDSLPQARAGGFAFRPHGRHGLKCR